MMRFGRANLIMTLVLLAVGFLVVYPLFMLLFGSFKGGPPGDAAPFTLRGYVDAYTSAETYRTLWTTFWLGAVRVALAMSLAIFLAWVVTRTDTPWRKGLEVLIWVQFFMPYQALVIAWTILASPQSGLINQAIMKVFHMGNAPLDIYSYGGIIWVSVLFWVSILFILITPAFRGMDAALEESSRMAGANGRTTLIRITIPLLAPALLGTTMLGFIRLMESFEAEYFLGYGKGIYVYTTRIWRLVGLVGADYPQAMALTTVFLGLLFGLILLQWKLLGKRQYITVTGKGFATRPTRLGKWRYVTLAVVLLYFVIGALLPLVTLGLGSFMRVLGFILEDPFTTQHWRGVLGDPRFLPSLGSTLVLALGAATAGMAVYSLISYIVVKTKFWGGKALDFVSWLPWGVPGLVLALGFLWAYAGGIPLPFTLYGTLWLMMLAFVVRGLPLGVRIMNGAMVQQGKELEESSRVLGASWFYTFRRVVAPLLSPAFVSAWIVLFLLAMRDLVTVIFLYSARSRVLSVLMFEYWGGGEYERAVAIGLVLGVLLITFALIARFLGSRQEIPT